MVQKEEKFEENEAVFRNTYLANYWANFLQIWYVEMHICMDGINYVNLIEIDPVVIEIREVENDMLAVLVNNTLVCHMAFLATSTLSRVLMASYVY